MPHWLISNQGGLDRSHEAHKVRKTKLKTFLIIINATKRFYSVLYSLIDFRDKEFWFLISLTFFAINLIRTRLQNSKGFKSLGTEKKTLTLE